MADNMSNKPDSLLGPECGHHCGARSSDDGVMIVGHCPCPECHGAAVHGLNGHRS